MDKEQINIISDTQVYVHEQLATEGSGHDYEHSTRVYRMALWLAEDETVNEFVIAIAALVHDLVDSKLVTSETDALDNLNYFLEGEGISSKDIEHILTIVSSISYHKHAHLDSREAEIVQDADYLDAIGAIGIARAFMYGGSKQQLIYSSQNDESTLQHFYDKLLHLTEYLHTDKAKAVGEKRQAVMEDYLISLLNEINFN